MFLVGFGTHGELQRLRDAGYAPLDCSDGRFVLSAPSVSADDTEIVAVFVPAGVTEILTPPFCPYCGAYMGDPASYYENDAHILHYRCGNCGAEERQVRCPPKTKNKEI